MRSLPLADLSQYLLPLADEARVGPGAPRQTVTASAVYGPLKLLGDTPTAREVVTQ